MILDCNEIIENRLWVGSYVTAEAAGLLRRLEISSVLSLQNEQDLRDHNIPIKKILKSYESLGIEYRSVPTPDFDRKALGVNLAKAVEELEQALAPRWARVYVHCTAGINRGPTVAAAYLMKSMGMAAKEAFDYVVARRYCSPYLSTLEEYEELLKNQDQSGTSR